MALAGMFFAPNPIEYFLAVAKGTTNNRAADVHVLVGDVGDEAGCFPLQRLDLFSSRHREGRDGQGWYT
jgi:hypothetical protein